jgi:hypothetical protein
MQRGVPGVLAAVPVGRVIREALGFLGKAKMAVLVEQTAGTAAAAVLLLLAVTGLPAHETGRVAMAVRG